MSKMGNEIALFCILHPASVEKKARVLSLLSAAKPYYQSPAAKCTTWTYFTPSTRLGVPSDLVPAGEHDTLAATFEIYTDKSALAVQTESRMFLDFHATVRAEQLYAAPEELTAWYPAAGFVSRGATAGPFGRGVLVTTGLHVCAPGQRDRFVDVMRDYAEWIKRNEPGCLSYSILTRPKAPDEMMVFERFVSEDAFRSHVRTPQFRQAIKAVRRYMKIPKGQEWTEADDAFVGNVLGGRTELGTSKL